MKTNPEPSRALLNRWKSTGWIVCGIAVVSFAAGSLSAARLRHVDQARPETDRVFELVVYHTVPGKVPAVESIFRDVAKLQAKHDINVVGYWVPDDKDPAWANTFIDLVAFPSREEANKRQDALHADPAFPELRNQTTPLIEKVDNKYHVDEVYMRPTEYSAVK